MSESPIPQALLDDIARRIRVACPDWTAEDLDRVVRRIAEVKLRYPDDPETETRRTLSPTIEGSILLVLALLIAPQRTSAAQPAPARSVPVLDSARTTSIGARPLSLEDAIRLASASNEAIRLARAGVLRARSQQIAARGQYLPQLSATGSYSRTLASAFGSSSGTTTTADTTTTTRSLCTPPLASGASDAERAGALGQAASCETGVSGGVDLSRAGFGADNTWNVGLDGSFGLLTPGRSAETARTAAVRRAADLEVTAQRAQLIVDVTEAYYDAALADQLTTIAEASLAQSERVLAQTQVARTVGDKSGYELLRAQVARENQIPTVLQRRSERDLAYFELRQLLNLPLDGPLVLTSAFELVPDTLSNSRLEGLPRVNIPDSLPDTIPAGVARASEAAGVRMLLEPSDTIVADRNAVRQQEQVVIQQESALRYARAQRLPSVSLTGSYGKVAYPTDVFPESGQWYTNSSVGISVSLPILTGGRQRSDELAARASLDESRARLDQTRKSATVDGRRAVLTLARAEATYAAGVQTVVLATRASQIAQVRYREGLALHTEVTEARIAETEARSNQASAARDVLVARIRLALLSTLPLAPETSGASTNTSSSTQSQ